MELAPGGHDCGSGLSSGSGSSAAASSGQAGGDEEPIVHFEWRQGQQLHSRYEVEKLLGDGTFGRVLLARDHAEDRQVAIKVIRDVQRYVENAVVEADILRDIALADPRHRSGCVVLHDTFLHDGRLLCLVFETLGMSLYDLIRANHFRGLWVQDLQSVARQCLKALNFLHTSLRLTHTDIKLENVLLQSTSRLRPCIFPRESWWQEMHASDESASSGTARAYVRPSTPDIKLIDFGNAVYEDEQHETTINTRQYRGPEVVLEAGWNEKSDLWSLGCILMELYTGELLFGTHDGLEHLALMERIVHTTLPQHMLQSAGDRVKLERLAWSREAGAWRLRWPEGASSASSQQYVEGQLALREMVLRTHHSLAECVASLLTIDPGRRPSAMESLRDPFFHVCFDD